MVLLGSEVKSLRARQAHLEEAWVGFHEGKLCLLDAHIAPFPQANRNNHAPDRARPLLLSSSELEKLRHALREKGLTLVPLEMYFDGPWAKLTIALGRGRKLHDKRQELRAKEDRKEAARAMRRG